MTAPAKQSAITETVISNSFTGYEATKQRAELEDAYLRAYDRARQSWRVLYSVIHDLPAPGSDNLNASHVASMNALTESFRKIS